MRKGEIIENTPIFDYFHLQSFGEKKDWEWRLQDVHGFIGESPSGNNYYISDNFKILLDNFKIAPKYHFYETRLLYKGKKLKYWIFQFIANYRKLNKMEFVNFSESTFYLNNQIYRFNSYEEWSDINEEIYDKYDEELKIKEIILTNFFDFIPLNPISSDIIISETLKRSIEENNITGFEFFELDYEVVVG
ncbi:hypothetical protein [Capnocytophaga catalasegens]|uniref:Immunity protein 43 domain-containing protein n=1 Tax=Capnocytophaga catalasegens TaxID=1004260 RepID=A0AAV5B107_9FLAO|nr:hypothetical protein [Capnocytophaga catalasegens]GIZ16108.1 hypothetical protein RCZ03_21080 [Capnocytophaga catalasegens]GJM51543.1 hypothetical protein RCZ15_25160 [Capnocytophaga catalasegens]GJM52884.1 hypothetical protein RCZ16_12010 [Capnocytophaga catalasegens]